MKCVLAKYTALGLNLTAEHFGARVLHCVSEINTVWVKAKRTAEVWRQITVVRNVCEINRILSDVMIFAPHRSFASSTILYAIQYLGCQMHLKVLCLYLLTPVRLLLPFYYFIIHLVPQYLTFLLISFLLLSKSDARQVTWHTVSDMYLPALYIIIFLK